MTSVEEPQESKQKSESKESQTKYDLSNKTLSQLLNESCEEHSWNVAALEGETGKQLTYSDLKKEASRLSAALHGVGCRKGEVVSVFCDRRLELVVAHVASLMSGFCFLFLDVSLPVNRLEFIVKDANVHVLLINTKNEKQTSTSSRNVNGSGDKNAERNDKNDGKNVSKIENRNEEKNEGKNEEKNKGKNEEKNEEKKEFRQWKLFADSESGRRLTKVYYQIGEEIEIEHGNTNDSRLGESDLTGISERTLQERKIAYLIYTSGSTGTPKGVLCGHDGLLNRLLWMQELFPISVGDRVLQKTPCTFDVSVWEFYWPLLFGGTIVLAKNGGHRDPNYLIQVIAQHKITHVHFLPTILGFFLHEMELLKLHKSESLRHVFCSGEALSVGVATKFGAVFGGFERPQLHNLYGPSEASIDVSFFTVTLDFLKACQTNQIKSIPIGFPAPNCQLYILNESRTQMVKDGEIGELLIGGIQLCYGYLNRPDYNATRFINNPFSKEKDILYCTGDLSRAVFDHKGNRVIEFCGRNDSQIKIAGMRVELSEIENVLNKFPQVDTSIILAFKDKNGEHTLLVAYIISPSHNKTNLPPTVNELKRYCENWLPRHMVPRFFFVLDQVPLTVNGKVDKTQLSQIFNLHLADIRHGDLVPPETYEERTMALIWQQVLLVDQVGKTDHFFSDLGGDSIHALRVVAKSREKGLMINIAQLYQHQTIEKICKALSTSPPDNSSNLSWQRFSLLTAGDKESLMKQTYTQQGLVEDCFPLSKLQAGMIFHSTSSPYSFCYQVVMNLAVTCHSIGFQRKEFEQSLQECVDHFPELRASFDLTSYSEPVQVILKQKPVLFFFEDLSLEIDKKKVDQRICNWFRSTASTNFDFHRIDESYIHFSVIKVSDKQFHFGMCFFDAILDGWSRVILMSHLFSLYHEKLEKNILKKDQKPNPWIVGQQAKEGELSFSQFVQQEMSALTNPTLKEFWKQTLANWTPNQLNSSTELIPDRNIDFIITIPPHQHQRLIQVCKEHGVSLKIGLLGIHLFVISQISQPKSSPEVISGVVFNGRLEGSGGDRIIGNHLNTLPFSVLIPDPKAFTWSSYLKAVDEMHTKLIAVRHFPLLEILKMTKTPTQSLFDTAFNFTDFHLWRHFTQQEHISSLHSFERIDFTDPFHYPLVTIFRVDEIDGRLDFVLNYNESMFTLDSIQQIAKLFLKCFENLSRNVPPPFGTSKVLRNLSNSSKLTNSGQFDGSKPDLKIERQIIALFHEIFGHISNINSQSDFVDLGGDSITVLQFCYRARKNGLILLPNQVLTHRTPQQIAQAYTSDNQILKSSNSENCKLGQKETSDGLCPLHPSQLSFLKGFDNGFIENLHWWNAEAAFTLPILPTIDCITKAIEILKGRHDVFRLRVEKDKQSGKWKQYYSLPALFPFQHIIMEDDCDRLEHSEAVKHIVNEMHTSLHLTQGPIFRIAFFQHTKDLKMHLFVIAAHHIFFDAISMQILADELSTLCRQIMEGKVPIDSKPTSLFEWNSYLHSRQLTLEEMEYWKMFCDSKKHLWQIIENEEDYKRNIYSTYQQLEHSFTVKDTSFILDTCKNLLKCPPSDLLITSLLWTIRKWKGEKNGVAFELMQHGRDQHTQKDIDLSHTIGELSILYPVVFEWPQIFEMDQQPDLQFLRFICKQITPKVDPITYGLFRFLSNPLTPFQRPPDIFFNYIGSLSSPSHGFCEGIQFLREDLGLTMPQEGEAKRFSVWEIQAMITDHQLTISWGYSSTLHPHSLIHQLLQDSIQTVLHLVSLGQKIVIEEHHVKCLQISHECPDLFHIQSYASLSPEKKNSQTESQ